MKNKFNIGDKVKIDCPNKLGVYTISDYKRYVDDSFSYVLEDDNGILMYQGHNVWYAEDELLPYVEQKTTKRKFKKDDVVVSIHGSDTIYEVVEYDKSPFDKILTLVKVRENLANGDYKTYLIREDELEIRDLDQTNGVGLDFEVDGKHHEMEEEIDFDVVDRWVDSKQANMLERIEKLEDAISRIAERTVSETIKEVRAAKSCLASKNDNRQPYFYVGEVVFCKGRYGKFEIIDILFSRKSDYFVYRMKHESGCLYCIEECDIETSITSSENDS
jgi:hypothetical protein